LQDSSVSQTYRATGINLKSVPMGETDRLLTVLTPEFGLVRGIAPGSRKHKSRLGGRSDLFVVNDWLVVKGKRLDKFVQAETQQTFPGLSQHLGRLTASQYLAEVVLFMALSDCSQAELFHLFVEHLERIETSPNSSVLAALCHGIYHLLALAGVAPEVHYCCDSRVEIIPDFLDSNWQVRFIPEVGGLVLPGAADKESKKAVVQSVTPNGRGARGQNTRPIQIRESAQNYRIEGRRGHNRSTTYPLSALHVALLQQLSKPELITTLPTGVADDATTKPTKSQELWLRIERVLREYLEHYLERPIRSASLVDVCMTTV
jgi:DNA repair protein RecO (recombination protein O)